MEKNIIDDVKIAVNTELDGYGFYTAASEKITDKHARTVFLHLASEELDHVRALIAISKSLKAGGGWLPYEEAIIIGEKSRTGAPIFPADNILVARLNLNPTASNALSLAIEAEEAAISFYSQLLKEAASDEEKALLTKILDMEDGHLKLLTWEQESITNTGFWCNMIEFSVEKERDE